MTAPGRRRALAPRASDSPLLDVQRSRLRIAWWVSPDAVRQAIGSWAATARLGRSQPTPELIRTAVGVACAVAELAASTSADADTLPIYPRGATTRAEDAGRIALTRPVAYDPGRLGEIAGASAREVERAVELLRQAGIVSQAHGDRGPLVLGGDCLVSAPAVAAIAWPAVRERLAAVGAPVAAPSATLRALAERVGAPDLSEGIDALPPVRMSVRDLELVTEFRRSTVSEAVAGLVQARLLDADTRAGHTGRFVLRPAAFGLSDEGPELPDRDAARARPITPGVNPAAARAPQPTPPEGRMSPAPTPGGAPVLIGTFAGTPIYAPQGTPLVVECDADGRWSCRVGPLLQLGPIESP